MSSHSVRRFTMPALALAFGLTWQVADWWRDRIHEVDFTEASALIASGALVVDVRDPEEFRSGHIQGAIPIPLDVLRNDIPVSIAAAKDQPVVVYCGHGQGRGPEGTRLLKHAGFSRAANLKGGIEAWKDARLPVEHG
jgi:rhodanese-related sulfurtransferase